MLFGVAFTFCIQNIKINKVALTVIYYFSDEPRAKQKAGGPILLTGPPAYDSR
jgi:hypothetical protein